jgi:predicted amidohydrolase YtcJ
MGRERLGGGYAWRSMMANGVPLALGSDFPVESPNPFPGLAVAVTREDAQGQPPGGWLPSKGSISLRPLNGFTAGAAYASFAEDRIGSLERGQFADFIFIDRDIFAVTPQQLRETKVLETYLAGRKVWQRR